MAVIKWRIMEKNFVNLHCAKVNGHLRIFWHTGSLTMSKMQIFCHTEKSQGPPYIAQWESTWKKSREIDLGKFRNTSEIFPTLVKCLNSESFENTTFDLLPWSKISTLRIFGILKMSKFWFFLIWNSDIYNFAHFQDASNLIFEKNHCSQLSFIKKCF